jgi:hypothetical protein
LFVTILIIQIFSILIALPQNGIRNKNADKMRVARATEENREIPSQAPELP